MSNPFDFETDWHNVDLQNSSHLAILDEYTFKALFLDIDCGISNITEETVSEHFDRVLRERVKVAKEIFEANLQNIVREAKKR